jgi:AraC-like DNA-binding protein
MILAFMPDLEPRPLTAANAAFRAAFYRRWGRENTIVCGSSRDAQYEAHPQTLSLKAAWGGAERYLLREREVRVDDDHWLILNHGRVYGSVLRAPRPVHSFALFFHPELPREVAGQRRRPLANVLDAPEPAAAAAPEFAEHLRPHGGAVSTRLRAMQHAVRAGERDQAWLDTQALLLMHDLLGLAQAPAAPRSARSELVRRLRLAADYIDSCHAEPLTLDDMARVACLSRYHFVRHFRALFGITPYAYLLRKRARVAQRQLAAGAVDREALALACGFGSRFALARALRRYADV